MQWVHLRGSIQGDELPLNVGANTVSILERDDRQMLVRQVSQ